MSDKIHRRGPEGAAGGGTAARAQSQGITAPSRPRLTMTTAVWGDWHLGMHFRVNLPTLLAPGNLPALARHCDLTYRIYTRAADHARIDGAPAIRRMRELMPVEIQVLPDSDLADPIAAHHKAWNLTTEEAAAEGSLVLLMPPDVAWSENSFASVGRRLERGERAVFMTYLRAESATFVEALLARQPKHDIVNAVPAREMVSLCVRSLHPLMAAYLRDSDYFPVHPEMMLWAVRGEGFAVRVLAREMFLYDPAHFAINQASLPEAAFKPGEASFMTDSDELFAVSLAPLGKDVDWHINPARADSLDIAGWWLTYDSPVNDFIVSQKIRWHFAPVTERKWRAVEVGADLFIRRTAAIREGMRIWQAARELGCTTAALLVALAVHTGPVQRAVRGRGPALVLIPSDAAFDRHPPGLVDRLLAPEGARELTRLLRAHHVPDAGEAAAERDPIDALIDSHETGSLASADGAVTVTRLPDGGYALDGARVVKGPLLAGQNAVYVVDALMGSLGR